MENSYYMKEALKEANKAYEKGEWGGDVDGAWGFMR